MFAAGQCDVTGELLVDSLIYVHCKVTSDAVASTRNLF